MLRKRVTVVAAVRRSRIGAEWTGPRIVGEKLGMLGKPTNFALNRSIFRNKKYKIIKINGRFRLPSLKSTLPAKISHLLHLFLFSDPFFYTSQRQKIYFSPGELRYKKKYIYKKRSKNAESAIFIFFYKPCLARR